MTHIRCSSLPRIMRCPGSAIPPETHITTETDESRFGTAAHSVIADCIETNQGPPNDFTPWLTKYGVDEDELCSAAWSAWNLWDTSLRHWFPNPTVEKEINTKIVGIELTGHPDLLSVSTHGSEVGVLDFKFGWKDGDYSDQVKGYLLIAMWNTGAERGYGAVCWPRTGEYEPINSNGWITRSELAEWWESVVAKLQAEPSYSIGDWCKYCPKIHECPALNQKLNTAVAIMDGKKNAVEAMQKMEYSAEETGWVLSRLFTQIKLIKQQIDSAEDAIKVALSAYGGRVPADQEGKELVLSEMNRSTIQAEPVFDWLYEEIGPPLLEAVTLGKTALEKLWKEKFPRGQKTKAVEELRKDLDAKGALKTSSFTKIELKTIPITKEESNGDSHTTAAIGTGNGSAKAAG